MINIITNNFSFYTLFIVLFYLLKIPLQFKFQIKKLFFLACSEKEVSVSFSEIFLNSVSSKLGKNIASYIQKDNVYFVLTLIEICVFSSFIFKNFILKNNKKNLDQKKVTKNNTKLLFFFILLEEILNSSFFYLILTNDSSLTKISSKKKYMYIFLLKSKIIIFLITICVIVFANFHLFVKPNVFVEIFNKNINQTNVFETKNSNIFFLLGFFCIFILKIMKMFNFIKIMFYICNESIILIFIFIFLLSLLINKKDEKINLHDKMFLFKEKNLLKIFYNSTSKIISFFYTEERDKKYKHKLNILFNISSLILSIRFLSSFLNEFKTIISFSLNLFEGIIYFTLCEDILLFKNNNFHGKNYYFFHFLSYLNKTSLMMFSEIKTSYKDSTITTLSIDNNKELKFVSLCHFFFFSLFVFNFICANLVKKDEMIIKIFFIKLSQKKLFFLIKKFTFFIYVKNFLFTFTDIFVNKIKNNISCNNGETQIYGYDIYLFFYSAILFIFHYYCFFNKSVSPFNKLTKLFLIEKTINTEEYLNNRELKKFLDERYKPNKNFPVNEIFNLIFMKIKTFFLKFDFFYNLKQIIRIISLMMIEIVMNSKLYLSNFIIGQQDEFYKVNFLNYIFPIEISNFLNYILRIKFRNFVYFFVIHVIYFVIEQIFFVILYFLFDRLQVRNNVSKIIKNNFKNNDLDFIFNNKIDVLLILMLAIKLIINSLIFFFYIFALAEYSNASIILYFRLPFFLSFTFSLSSLALISIISL